MSSNSNTCDRQISPVNHITFTDIMIFQLCNVYRCVLHLICLAPILVFVALPACLSR